MTEEIHGFQSGNDAVTEDQDRFGAAIAELRARCKAAGISFREDKAETTGNTFYSVELPCGREKRAVSVWGLARAQSLLSSTFEKYVAIGGYEAICSYELNTIEAAIYLATRSGPTSSLWERFFRAQPSPMSADAERFVVERTIDGNVVRLSVGEMSELLQVMDIHHGARSRFSRMSLRIEGIDISRHDQALSLLERIASSFFFQVDMGIGITFALRRSRDWPRRRYRNRVSNDISELEFPRVEYDAAPMALYWYARSAVGMPLLQFLAYYQVIEFYFPVYSQAEARRHIMNVLKDPTFRMDRDADIGRILSLVQPGGNLGNERSQLRATLHECLDPGDLRRFVVMDEDRLEALGSKIEGLTDHKIATRNPDADLRDMVSERLYDIRCKVVHTKGADPETGIELLLPGSKEAAQMCYDIELVEYIARRVLIAASAPLAT